MWRVPSSINHLYCEPAIFGDAEASLVQIIDFDDRWTAKQGRVVADRAYNAASIYHMYRRLATFGDTEASLVQIIDSDDRWTVTIDGR